MRLFRFRHSCYAFKVQAVLELARVSFEAVDVPYADRTLLLTTTGGYGHVPVVVLDDGEVLAESRDICESLLRTDPRFRSLVPEGREALVWGYSDWVDSGLEETLFKLAAPGIRKRLPGVNERGLYTLIKERKYGTGCLDDWATEQPALAERTRSLLEPSNRTLRHHPFLCGDTPTLADAALYGQMAMLAYGDPALLPPLGEAFSAWLGRLFAADVSRENWEPDRLVSR